MPYCGLKTSLNKKLWCLAATATLLCVACVIAYVVTGTECLQQLEDAGCVNRRDGYRVTPSNNTCVENNNGGVCTAVTIVIWLAILFFILATVPCCIMCCCAPKPKPKYHDAPVAHTYDAGHGHHGHHGHHGTHGSYDTYGAGEAHHGQPAGTYDMYGNGGGYDHSGGTATGGHGYGKPGGDVYDQYGGAPPAHHGGYTKPSPAV